MAKLLPIILNLRRNTVKAVLLAFSFIVIFSCSAVYAQNEKELAVKTARALETNPLSEETASMEKTALKWVIETNDVHLIVCGGVFELFSDKKNKNSSDMTAAYTIGMAAFKIEHPDQANDENAAQLAGLETALKNYVAIVKQKPKTKFEKVDALVEKMNSGQLAAVVNALDCGKK